MIRSYWARMRQLLVPWGCRAWTCAAVLLGVLGWHGAAPAQGQGPSAGSGTGSSSGVLAPPAMGGQATRFAAPPVETTGTTAATNSSFTPEQERELRRRFAEFLQAEEEKKKKEAEQKKREAEAKGFEVGSDLSLGGIWSNGLVLQSPRKDWLIHVGGRFQFQSVLWRQPEFLQGPPPGNGGLPGSPPGGGVGPLDDGMFFRRVRFRSDGIGYELVEYVLEVDFEQLNLLTFDHVWVGFKELPLLGTVRIGQHKVPQGLEMMSSDYHLTFLQDRSSLSDAFWTLFAPGIFLANTYFDQNVTFQTMFHRIQPLQFYNADFGDGDYASTSRLTWTPYYADEGRCLVHVGGSYQWRHGDLGRTVIPGGTGNTFADTQHVTRFRARPELRDATGVTFPFGDAARFVDTGFLLADNIHTVSPEFLWIEGPFSVQAEGAWACAENARSIYPAAAFGTARGTPLFWGGYIQASYFLTGEHRGYDRRFGTPDRPKVNENFFSVRGQDGRCHFGLGAWEVAYRYSYLELNDNGINGGRLAQHSVGLNWYCNDNLKIQFMYLNSDRNVAAPANSGIVHGFGTLAQWYF